MTQAAKDELDKLQGEGRYLRIALSRSGCCSLSLKFFVDQQQPHDHLIETDGYGLLVTDQEKPILNSIAQIDYGRKGVFKDFKAVMR